MSQNLVIVESPAKAKTIEKYLGSAFTVRSSFGHIRDLPERGIGIDVAKGFAPEYVVSDDKKGCGRPTPQAGQDCRYRLARE
jgi:DNA topoisomerase-1